MAAGDLVYGAAAALPNVARIQSLANGAAQAFGEIDNSALGALDFQIHLVVPLVASMTSQMKLYMVESRDGTAWTDNIDPASAGDVAAKISDARLIKVIDANFDAADRTEAELHFNVLDFRPWPAPFFGFVLLNESTLTTPASGADGNSRSIKIAQS